MTFCLVGLNEAKGREVLQECRALVEGHPQETNTPLHLRLSIRENETLSCKQNNAYYLICQIMSR